jgi:hypothetical protein
VFTSLRNKVDCNFVCKNLQGILRGSYFFRIYTNEFWVTLISTVTWRYNTYTASTLWPHSFIRRNQSKKFTEVYETRRFIVVFTKKNHGTLLWTILIQCVLSSSEKSRYYRFPHEQFVYVSHLPHASSTLRPFKSP